MYGYRFPAYDGAMLLLAVGALAASAPATDYCHQLHLKYANMSGVVRPEWPVSVYGTERQVSLWWDGSAPSRAAAALLLAALRHGLRYRGLRLRRAADLHHIISNRHQLAVAPAFAAQCDGDFWRRVRAAAWLRAEGAGARGRGRGAGASPPAAAAAARPARPAHRAHPAPALDDPELAVNSQYKWYNIGLEEGVSAESQVAVLPLASEAESRRQLLRALQTNASFLFFDYDIWEDVTDVLPIRAYTSTSCEVSSDLSCSFRLFTKILQKIAPPLYNVMRRFVPFYKELREVLELESRHSNVTEAACEWALTNGDRFESWFRKDSYRVIVFLCENDLVNEYENAINTVMRILKRRMTNFEGLELWTYNIKCDDEFDSTRIIEQAKRSSEWARTVGALAAGAGAPAAAAAAALVELALVWCDSAPAAAALGDHTRALGAPAHSSAALGHLLHDCRWRRLAVLSEDSHLAGGLLDELIAAEHLALNNTPIKENTIESSLNALRNMNARIILVNTNAKFAMSILCEACRQGMTRASGYVWILREWHGIERISLVSRDCVNRMSHYTISFWWRGGDWISKGVNDTDSEIRRALDALWPHKPWPLLAAPLADGLILLLNSFNAFIEKYPLRQHNLHAPGTTRLIWNSLERSVPGVIQKLYAKPYASAEPLVVVDEWRGTERLPVAVCNATSCIYNQTHYLCFSYGSYDVPSDGSRFCLTTNSHNGFVQHCNDLFWSIAATISILAIICIYIARRVRMRRLKYRDHQSITRLLAPAKLADHLVDRAALEFRQELGSGRFGRVQFAILRTPNRPTQAVAVKSLRNDASSAEETEFLGEACTLASIAHRNIVRLIGVCATGGPPLLLMEHVFFGDLLGYLRGRRHLVEHVDDKIPEEATHVSPYALTKLAREASSALAYLTKRQIVHRDVRASNCLVDARRSLKLADFGMARETIGNDGAAEYACRRRGFFPALWMAPESLDRGVFSPATDVWALGVLMFEMVTLGERPYGEWSPLRVLRYIIAGGRPPLPSDASLKTRGVLLSCWRHRAEQRPTATEIAAYLYANPLALSPALEIAPLPPEPFNYIVVPTLV
ncbi:uncharacterized protein ACR2FA_008279 [Aphomia sociella]